MDGKRHEPTGSIEEMFNVKGCPSLQYEGDDAMVYIRKTKQNSFEVLVREYFTETWVTFGNFDGLLALVCTLDRAKLIPTNRVREAISRLATRLLQEVTP
jgi:hypothetical protein